jgi:hypothetical protein
MKIARARDLHQDQETTSSILRAGRQIGQG